MKIGELFVALGLKVDQAAIARFNSSINNLKRDIFLVQAAFIGAAFAIDRFVDGTIKGVVSLQNLNNQTGLSIDKLQRLQQAGQLADLTLTPDAIAQSVANLQKNITDITKLGKGNFRPFQILGLDPTSGDAFQVIDQLRDRIKGLDPTVATNLIQELGLSPQFINILKLSRREFEKLSQNTFLNRKQRDLILQAGTAMTRLKLQMKALKDQAVAKLSPLLIEITEKFFIWIKNNGKKVADTIATIVRGLTNFVIAISRAVGFVSSLVENLFGVENGIKIVIAAIGLLSIALLPFKSLLLIATAIILVLEDIAVWMRGGQSLFGTFLGKVQEVFTKFSESISEMFSNLKSKIKETFDSATESVMKFFGRIKSVFTQIKEFIQKNLIDPLTKLDDFLINKVKGAGKFLIPSFGASKDKTGNTNNTTNNFNIDQTLLIDQLQDVSDLQRSLNSIVPQISGGVI